MAGDLSGTGCPVVCQEKGWLVICQEQELSVKETKILWSVRNKIAGGLSVRGIFVDAWWSIMDKRIVRSANAYLLLDDINIDMP
jgi:hypothetical protein